MKLRYQSKCYLKKKQVVRGREGEKYAAYSPEYVELHATIYSGSGKLAGVQAGNVQQYQKKLLLDEPYTITNEDGVETYWLGDHAFSMAAGDGVCVYSGPEQDPDYRIVSIHPTGHLNILLERLQ